MDHSPFLTNLSILVIDDEQLILDTIRRYIEEHGGQCTTALSFLTALKLVENFQFDLVICDYFLNGDGTGVDFIDKIKSIDPDLSSILITGKIIDDALSKIIYKNIYALLYKPFDFKTMGFMILQAAKNTRNLRRIAYQTENLNKKIAAIQMDLSDVFINTLLALTNALEQKDEYTKNHSEMVGQLAKKICWEYTDDEKFISDVLIAGKLHDIGKIGIKDDILFKVESLTIEEFDTIKKHSEMSYKIIKPVDSIGKISSYILHHHERWDGTGYPHKLKEKGIPAGARILSVADTFNALTSNRPYRKAKDRTVAMQVLFDNSGKQFDPEIVEIIFRLIKSGRIDTKEKLVTPRIKNE